MSDTGEILDVGRIQQVVEPEAPILTVRDLRTHFITKRGLGLAVDGVSFDLFAGETLGLVGESGSGKSMTCMSIVRLHPMPASRIVAGEVRFKGTNLLAIPEAEMRTYRGRHIAMITQDPGTALNPVFTIGDQLFESLRLPPDSLRGHGLEERAIELLTLLRIPSPKPRLKNYPHQFSGGMRQRVVGAIALSRTPEVIIADEPTTALDATIQAAYLDVLRDIQHRLGVSIILVTHDFSIVASMCDRVAVMYAGKIVEMGPKQFFFSGPRHPYSEALLASVPDVNVAVARLPSIDGQPPSIFDPPTGCRFHPRCPLRARLGDPMRCVTEEPLLHPVGPGHTVACHFTDGFAPAPEATHVMAATGIAQ
jgi:oligopeptide/dipeptide ABC transporter ATP-binding protein